MAKQPYKAGSVLMALVDLNGDVRWVMYCRGATNPWSFLVSPRSGAVTALAALPLLWHYHARCVHLSSLDERHKS